VISARKGAGEKKGDKRGKQLQKKALETDAEIRNATEETKNERRAFVDFTKKGDEGRSSRSKGK